MARKTEERLAFEADRMRMRLEGRIVMKSLLNEWEEQLELIHANANAQGRIPRVDLDISDLADISKAARKLLGTAQIDGA